MDQGQYALATDTIIGIHNSIVERIEHASTYGVAGRSALDLGLYLVTAGLGQVAIKVLAQISARLGSKGIGGAIKAIGQRVGVFEKEAAKRGGQAAAAITARAFAHLPVKVRAIKLAALIAFKQRLLLNFMGKKELLRQIGKNAIGQWKYIGLNAGMQTIGEARARWDQIYVPGDPLLTAKNLFTNEQYLENTAFMTSETAWMMGVRKTGMSTKGKFLTCAFFALGNSLITNIFIRDQNDARRISFDTGWEVTIGNMQVWLDDVILRRFEGASKGLQVVGYALTMVDATAGYYVYSNASTWLDENLDSLNMENIGLKLVPVFGPAEEEPAPQDDRVPNYYNSGARGAGGGGSGGSGGYGNSGAGGTGGVPGYYPY